MNLKNLKLDAARHLDKLQGVRRDIHRQPELGLHTPKTLERVLTAISGLPIEVIRPDSGRSHPDNDSPMTSAIVRITGRTPGPTVVLRADLDALSLHEDADVDFASEIPGLMHACGHDLHAAIAVGAIHLLATNKDDLAGEVLFFLQPGEEGYRGANIMLEDGALSHATGPLVGAYALHVSSNQPLGQFLTKPGSLMAAAATLDVTVNGSGGHGSAPHLARDPNQALAEIITGLQTMVTRRFNTFDPVIITVGWLIGGERGTNNVIPSSASFGATVRVFSREHLDAVERYSREFVDGIAAAYGLSADIEFTAVMEPLINDPEHVELAERVAVDMFGAERFTMAEAPIGGAEDFAAVLREVPGAFVFVGACPPGLDPATAPYNHSNLARFDDAVLSDASAYLAALAFARLSGVNSSK